MSRGGTRPGAGRGTIDPQFKKIPVGYKLPKWLVDWIRAQDNTAAGMIETALIKQHKLTPPTE